jgi:hypothetical protein
MTKRAASSYLEENNSSRKHVQHLFLRLVLRRASLQNHPLKLMNQLLGWAQGCPTMSCGITTGRSLHKQCCRRKPNVARVPRKAQKPDLCQGRDAMSVTKKLGSKNGPRETRRRSRPGQAACMLKIRLTSLREVATRVEYNAKAVLLGTFDHLPTRCLRDLPRLVSRTERRCSLPPPPPGPAHAARTAQPAATCCKKLAPYLFCNEIASEIRTSYKFVPYLGCELDPSSGEILCANMKKTTSTMIQHVCSKMQTRA